MADEWSEVRFQTLFSEPLRNGLTRPKAVRGAGTQMINMGEVFAHSRIADIQMERVPLSEKEAERYLLQSGDLLFARQSLVLSGAGKCCYVLNAEESRTFESHIIRARLNSSLADPLFYYYFFNSPIGRQRMESIVEQVAAAGIRGSDLAVLDVPLPNLKEQWAIARILGTLDDKIELNRRTNETLQSVARAIFKSWFVDFDPVRLKMEGRQPEGMDAETAALFPDSFEGSDVGRIPRGWKSGILGDIAQNSRTSIRAEDLSGDMPYIGLEHIPRRSIALSAWGYAHEVKSNKYVFSKGDFLFGKLRPYFHKVGVTAVDGVCSTDILVVQPREAVFNSLVLMTIASDDFIAHTDSSSTGTKMPRTSWADMSRYQIAIPTVEVTKAFYEITMPLVDRIQSSVSMSRTLIKIRDTLLPKLISGELRVPAMEKIVEEMADG
jgi:type I restriction enzyme S subunit